MSLVQDMKWTASSIENTTNPKKLSSFVSSCESIRPLPDHIIDKFIRNMPGGASALHTIIFPDEKRRNTAINDKVFLSSWYNEQNKLKSLSELIEIGKSMQLKLSQVDLAEITNVIIRKSKAWTGLIRGRVSGSDFKDCCSANIKNPSVTLINRLMNPKSNLDNIPSVKFQRKFKGRAIKDYLHDEQTKHDDFKNQQCGLLISPRTPYFITSADGFVSCECHGRGCIEIKCIKALENGDSFDILTRSKILYKREDEYFLDKNHSYFYKVQMQIHLAELDYCDIVFWCPTKFLTLRINPDTNFWTVSKHKAILFHQEVMMPELLGKFYTIPKG